MESCKIIYELIWYIWSVMNHMWIIYDVIEWEVVSSYNMLMGYNRESTSFLNGKMYLKDHTIALSD